MLILINVMCELNERLNEIADTLYKPAKSAEEYIQKAEKSEAHYSHNAKKMGHDYITARYFKDGFCFATSCVYKGFKEIKDVVEIIVHW